jgi:hypothetical protein
MQPQDLAELLLANIDRVLIPLLEEIYAKLAYFY